MENVTDKSAVHPQVVPRIGNEYQADIPPLIAKFERLEITNKHADSEVLDLSFSLGLPIPWKNSEAGKFKGNVESVGSSKENEISELEVKPRNAVLGDARDVEDSQIRPWSKIEEDSFLLSLYVFGKNLTLVKRFIGSRDMGDVLCFYYGKFYSSDGYRRWSKCRKLKGNPCIQGERVFTGWRQKELLSRLFFRVSKDCEDMLMESSRCFAEGKILFEEYIFKLKDIVGVRMLIEAVGIGKGKQDLTGTTLKPTKNSLAISFRPEVPIGKACSSLTTPEIIKYLTRDFKLSKKRSNDLFWEAVWPRLLARGWHSEQRNLSLVFLVPGIEKFSRRLVRGNQYFDSVHEVLKNVASNPDVLELDNEAAKGREEESAKFNEVDMLNKQHRHDLLPHRSTNGDRDLMKFTIVDTSMLHVAEAEQSKVRKLKSLPVQTESISTPSNLFTETEQDIYEESKDDAEEKITSNPAEDIIDRTTFLDSSDCVTSIQESQCLNLLNDRSPSKATDYNCIPTLKSDDLRYLATETKQKDLTDCNDGDSSCSDENVSVDKKLTPDEPLVESNLHSSRVGLHREAASEKSQSWICIDLNLPYVPTDADTDKPLIKDTMQTNDNTSANGSAFDSFLSKTSEQPEPLKLPELLTKDMMQNNDNSAANKSSFDSFLSETSQLELPKLPEPVIKDMAQRNDDSSVKKTTSLSETSKQPFIKSQRQSTRNRPLTMKVREAIEHDLFRTRRKRKGETLQNKSTTPRSQRARGSSIINVAFDDSVAANTTDTRIEDEHSDRDLQHCMYTKKC